MIPNNPKIRLALYAATVVVGAAAIVLGHVGPSDWADAARELGAYLGLASGVAAASNLSPGAGSVPPPPTKE